MKYIKLFENNSYSEISEDDFDDIIYFENHDKHIKFTELEVEKLSSLGMIEGTHQNYQVSIFVIAKGIIIHIYKLPDEWYYVKINISPKSVNIKRFDKTRNTLHYKCDQWDGLINCINSL